MIILTLLDTTIIADKTNTKVSRNYWAAIENH